MFLDSEDCFVICKVRKGLEGRKVRKFIHLYLTLLESGLHSVREWNSFIHSSAVSSRLYGPVVSGLDYPVPCLLRLLITK